MALAGAPAGCQLRPGKPQEMTKEMARRLAQIPPGEQIPENSYGAAVRQQDVGEMSMTQRAGGRAVIALTVAAAVASCACGRRARCGAGAGAGPFGAPRGNARPAAGGRTDRLDLREAGRVLPRRSRAASAPPRRTAARCGRCSAISFLYGIFHAAGPGHGKAVISSYLVANEETWRRGVVLSFASAMLQAFVAVAFVGIAAALLNATAAPMCNTERVIEIVSYALIALIGARLVWVKGGLHQRSAQHEPAAARGRRRGDAARPQTSRPRPSARP